MDSLKIHEANRGGRSSFGNSTSIRKRVQPPIQRKLSRKLTVVGLNTENTLDSSEEEASEYNTNLDAGEPKNNQMNPVLAENLDESYDFKEETKEHQQLFTKQKKFSYMYLLSL